MKACQTQSTSCRGCCLADHCLFDDFYHEILVLENSVHGLCNWLKHYDERLGDEKQLGVMVQLARVKAMLAQF